MDTKNIIAAISLSAAVIILYSLFFAPPPPDPKQVKAEKNKVTQNTSDGDAPSLELNEETIKILLISISSISRGIISSTLWSQYTLSSGEYAKG